MTRYCGTCTKTGVLGERVELISRGSRYIKNVHLGIFQCPICDTVKAETQHPNGFTTSQILTAEEVAQIPRERVGLLGVLALVAAVVVASKS